jgi:hypothetical protein
MSNSFTLRDGQTVTIDFAQEPTLVDFAKLIALLELQRSFLDGSPGPVVVVEFRSPTLTSNSSATFVDNIPQDHIPRLVPRMNGADEDNPFFAGQNGMHSATQSVAEGTVSNSIVQDPPDDEEKIH